ncbi:MAG: hypothetical protein B6I35_14665, partial [Anaerolineaceae bacterium 4572_32.2]
GKKQRARDGLWNGSPPLGYCRGNCSTCEAANGPGYCPHAGQPDRSSDKGLVIHPIESIAVELAFEWYATGEFSDGQIAEKLNDHVLPDENLLSLRSKGRPGRSDPGPFSKDSIRDVLQNHFYTGVVPYYEGKGKRREPVALYQGQHAALIDQERFDECQELRSLHSTRPRKRGDTVPRAYPLSGLLYCGGCNSKMRAQTGSSTNGPYYVCSGRLQHTTSCDDISKARYEEEKRNCERELANLRPTEICDTISLVRILVEFERHWARASNLEKKKLLRGLVAAAYVRGQFLQAIQPKALLYPLLQNLTGKVGFYSGSDGI